MSRSLELNLALPDPIILSGVLHRFADALGKLGGTQLAYRVASVRQELGVDIRPGAVSIEQYAEYLQSEAEETELGDWLEGHNCWSRCHNIPEGHGEYGDSNSDFEHNFRRHCEVSMQVLEDYGGVQTWSTLYVSS